VAIAFVQNKDFNGSTGASSYTPAYNSNVTAGNLLVALIYPSGTNSVTSVTDSLSQTWTQISGASGTTTDAAYIYYQKNTAGGACTLTITLGAASNCNPIIYEFSGLDTSAPLDQSNTATGTSTSTTSGTVTTTVANELLIGGAHVGGTINAGESGWTAIAPTTRGNLAEYIIVSSIQTNVAATGTQGSATYRGNIATFKAASGGTVTLPSVTMQFLLGITPLKIVAQLGVNMQFLLGLTPVKLLAALTTAMQFKLGITNISIRELIGPVTMQFKLGITTAQLQARLSTGMQVRIGISPVSVTGGGAQTLVTFYFGDGTGIHRIVQENPVTGD
jgi:hypothetical protein